MHVSSRSHTVTELDFSVADPHYSVTAVNEERKQKPSTPIIAELPKPEVTGNMQCLAASRQNESPVLIIIGPPGSGKGTQCQDLSRTMKIPHISTGDLLRDNIRRGTEAASMALLAIERGDLLPDELMLEMVELRISQPDCAFGVILDGIPRTRNQAICLDRLLRQRRWANPVSATIIRLVISESAVVKRALNRRRCPTCGIVYGPR